MKTLRKQRNCIARGVYYLASNPTEWNTHLKKSLLKPPTRQQKGASAKSIQTTECEPKKKTHKQLRSRYKARTHAHTIYCGHWITGVIIEVGIGCDAPTGGRGTEHGACVSVSERGANKRLVWSTPPARAREAVPRCILRLYIFGRADHFGPQLRYVAP